MRALKTKISIISLVLLFVILLSQIPLFDVAYSKHEPVSDGVSQGNWWELGVIEGEVVVPGYIQYSQLLPALREIEKTSNRVRIEVIGESAWGYPLLLVTISDPSTLGRLGAYKSLAKDIVDDPVKVMGKLDKGNLDYKAPIYLSPSIHGNEMGGVDAALQIIRELAYDDTEEIHEILDNLIVLVNPCMNPDGRIANRRQNGYGFDLNRDGMPASQPEIQTQIGVYKEWNPLVTLIAHGYQSPRSMLIEPATIPMNPNAQFDKIERWYYPMALAQAEALTNIGITVTIPYRDYWAKGGWDGYYGGFVASLSMYHGSIGQCSEAPRGDFLDPIGSPDDILAHYTNMKTALKFTAEHGKEMLRNQLELFERGTEGYGWDFSAPAWNLPEATVYDPKGSLYQFPYAYIIPMDDELQSDPNQAAKLLDKALLHGIELSKASAPFNADGVTYPAGTYVVLMHQAKSGLANNLLWSGEDLSYDPGVAMYDDAAWNIPQLWGVTVVGVDEEFSAKLQPANNIFYPLGDLVGFPTAYAYALKGDTNNAINMVNSLLDLGIVVDRTDLPFTYKGMEFGVGTFIIPADQPKIESILNNLVKDLHLTLYGIDEDVGISYHEITTPRIAILNSPGVSAYSVDEISFMLNNFGFEFELVTNTQVGEGVLSNYDVLYVPDGTASRIWTGLEPVAQGKLMEFIDEGGTCIVVAASTALLNYAHFLDATAVPITIPSPPGGRPNGVVRVNYDPLDLATAYYPEDGYAFVYYPVKFADLGPGIKAVATLAPENVLVAGYWPGYESSEGAPIMIHGAYGAGEVVLIGTPVNRRALSDGMYRLITNSIYP